MALDIILTGIDLHGIIKSDKNHEVYLINFITKNHGEIEVKIEEKIDENNSFHRVVSFSENRSSNWTKNHEYSNFLISYVDFIIRNYPSEYSGFYFEGKTSLSDNELKNIKTKLS
tara:strand:- start:198 stop:542 length:345 start_codon:yes stop_codon:yes gene_type:complete